jgi:hypothetical protein
MRKHGSQGCSRNSLSCPSRARNGPASSVKHRPMAAADTRRDVTDISVGVSQGVADELPARV